MNRTCQRLTLVLLAAATALACGEPAERLTAVRSPDPLAAATVCDAAITAVRPEGVLPAARTSSIVVEHSGHALAGEVKVRAAGPAGEVPTSILLGAGAVEVSPEATLAPGSYLVEASLCDSHAVRAFEVGALHHALSNDAWAALAGTQVGLDLRYGSWTDPEPRGGRELIVRALFAGALVVDVIAAADGQLLAAVGAAEVGDGAAVVAVPGEPAPASPLLVANPYALAPFSRLDLRVDGRSLTLRDGALVLGFTDEGVADARLAAEVDLRDFGPVDGSDACELVALHTFGVCAPCASDGAPWCFALTLDGLAEQP
ncbi:MAG: hypothetical protein A2138_11855 [Deltaproteobacteria bacterium RBG_16_71_12]|nr:MAG: hypothetical protein A2138_11855 [Deltaproteobacteria bacterium RBG_16_71_12]